MLHRHGVEVGVHQVILARPRQLDRLALHRFGHDGGLDDEVRLGLPAKPAAEQGDVHGDIGGDSPSRFATRSRAAWGDCTQPHTSHLPLAMRTVAAGGSIGAWARWGM